MSLIHRNTNQTKNNHKRFLWSYSSRKQQVKVFFLSRYITRSSDRSYLSSYFLLIHTVILMHNGATFFVDSQGKIIYLKNREPIPTSVTHLSILRPCTLQLDHHRRFLCIPWDIPFLDEPRDRPAGLQILVRTLLYRT